MAKSRKPRVTAEAQQASGPSASATLGFSNSDALQLLTQGLTEDGAQRWGDCLRNAEDIENSGVLETMKQLEGIEVPDSEYDRSIDDDAVLVMQDLAQYTPEELAALKEAAYDDEEGQAKLDEALEVGHYGSSAHKEYGALIERLTGGVISAEEAMAMSPGGGLIGPCVSAMRHLDGIDSLRRHAVRHDATGFLIRLFQAGPGYGTKNAAWQLDSDNPMAGQVLGWAREIFKDASEFDDASHVATPSRFGAPPTELAEG